jgi:macrodomain Ter protein organizer (MatP/YcbG family)
MKNQDLEKVTASIVYSYLALHHNEQVKHTGYYKSKLKETLRPALIQLQKIERKEFDKMESVESNVTHQISSNIITYMEQMIKGSFTDTLLLANMQIAYKKNPAAIEGIINKVLNN